MDSHPFRDETAEWMGHGAESEGAGDGSALKLCAGEDAHTTAGREAGDPSKQIGDAVEGDAGGGGFVCG